MTASPAAPAAPEPAEAQLVERLRAGDEDAFGELVRSHAGRMLSVARRYLDEEDARDAVQDAFLAVFRSISGFDGRAQLKTWLHRIVVNAALMKLRTRRRKPETSIEELLPRFLEDGYPVSTPAPWRPEAHERIERKQTRALLRRLIAQLPDPYRSVLVLRDVEELSTRETAEELAISESNVKVRLHRARQALREMLDPHLREVTR